MNINTKQIKSDGQDIWKLANQLSVLTQSFYDKIIQMNNKTFEWVGPASEKFAALASDESKNTQEFENKLRNFASILINCANSYQKVIANYSSLGSDFSKFYLNSQGINSRIVDKISSASTSSYNSVNNVGYLKIPYGFTYSQYLKNLINKNEETRISIVDEKNKILDAVKKIESVQKSNLNVIIDIPRYELPKRKSIN